MNAPSRGGSPQKWHQQISADYALAP